MEPGVCRALTIAMTIHCVNASNSTPFHLWEILDQDHAEQTEDIQDAAHSVKLEQRHVE
jgi:hypothetical protein